MHKLINFTEVVLLPGSYHPLIQYVAQDKIGKWWENGYIHLHM
jgi:hypothetical protein